MNKTSTNKIRLATPFLTWFRRCLPKNLQTMVRPYLDQPYQLSLNILDCCHSSKPLGVGEIAQAVGVTRETARQVLLALKEGGMAFAVSPTQSWQTIEAEPTEAEPTSPDFSDLNDLKMLEITRGDALPHVTARRA